jgi:hypothetical protein
VLVVHRRLEAERKVWSLDFERRQGVTALWRRNRDVGCLDVELRIVRLIVILVI